MRLVPLLLLLVLAACADPRLSTNLSLGTDGLSVNPTLSGKVGGATVSIDP
jgi:hypothetical protein